MGNPTVSSIWRFQCGSQDEIWIKTLYLKDFNVARVHVLLVQLVAGLCGCFDRLHAHVALPRGAILNRGHMYMATHGSK